MSMLLKAEALQEERLSPTHRSRCLLMPLSQRQGYAFFLAHVEKTFDRSETFFQTVEEHMERLSSSFGKETNAQHRFEQFLSALNESCAARVCENAWSFPMHRLSSIVGMATDHAMYLSGTGDLTALFLHKKPSSQYQIFDLSRSIKTEQSLPTWEKTFAVVLDGEWHPGDAFCLSNQDLRRAMKADDLHTILATLPPAGAIEAIRQHFPLEAPLSLVILQAASTESSSAAATAKPRSELSLQNLKHTREQTETYLQDQAPHTLSAVWRAFRHWIFPTSKTNGKKSLTRFDPILRFLWRLLWCSLRVATRMSVGCTKDAIWGSRRLAQKETRAHLWSSAREKTLDAWFHFKRTSHRLPKTTKYLLLAILLTCTAFGIGIAWRQRSQGASEARALYLSHIAEVQTVLDRAQSALIYKDEEQARTLYAQAEASLTILPKETPEEQQNFSSLEEQIQTGMDTLRHVVLVPDPPMLGDLSLVEGTPYSLSLLPSEDKLFILGSDGKLYELQKTQKTFTVAQEGPFPFSTSSVLGSFVDATLAFLDPRPGITLSANGSIAETDIVFSEEQILRALHGYGDRLYLLVKEKGDATILRASVSGNEAGALSSWIKTKTTNLGMAMDFAIDGTIYVLLQDGSVVQFVGGNEAAWRLGVVEPAMTNAQAIWTDVDSAYVYVLEPSQKRLMIFEKETGTFVVQYVSDLLEQATAFHISESSRSMYFLSGDRLYTMAASHL